MRRICWRHRAWKASSLQMSALPHHPMCREHISLEMTQAEKMWTFFDVSSTACFHTRHKA